MIKSGTFRVFRGFRGLRRYIIYAVLLICLVYSAAQSLHFTSTDYVGILSRLRFQKEVSTKLIPLEIFDEKLQDSNYGRNKIIDSFYTKIFSEEAKDSNWKLSDGFKNFEVEPSRLHSYIKQRESQHFYDPRITLSVYLSHFNQHLGPDYIQDIDSIPFSWQDWVDLSYLNEYLNSDENDSRINCSTFFQNYDVENKFFFDPTVPSIDFFNKTNCLDDIDYLETEQSKYRNPKLLPGFNFRDRMSQKSNFLGKVFNAKSHVLSYLDTPSFVYFLHDNGTYYRVKTHQSKTMMENGMFENFISQTSFNNFNPIEELSKMKKQYIIHNENDFSKQLNAKNKYELHVPDSKFILNPEVAFSSLYSTDYEDLYDHERKFLESIEYSKSLRPQLLNKYFKEVNIKWPASYNGHRLVENGGHYDSRFFSGFLTEMPSSDLTFHSPNYEPYKKTRTSDKTINRRLSILSHLIHTLLTVSFHDGLFMYPAHGSLLAWYFTGTSFPWDSDGDVQMPIEDLATFCLNYNNSMIVQNPKYGLSKYFVDCTSSLTHRSKGNGQNNIDARVIDVDTGYYVDLTGLSVSSDALTRPNLQKLNEWIPLEERKDYPVKIERSTKKKAKNGSQKGSTPGNAKTPNSSSNLSLEQKKLLDAQVFDIHKRNRIYNCRNDHYYTYEQLSPVRVSLFEGAPALVPASEKSLKAVLSQEYGTDSMIKSAFEDWVYSKPLRMWIESSDIFQVCLINDIPVSSRKKNSQIKKKLKGSQVFKAYMENEALMISELLKLSLYEITGEEAFSNYEKELPELNIFEESFHTKRYSTAHSKEMKLFMNNWEWGVNVKDYSEIPDDWNSLATWMLLDHRPPKLPLLDYLIFVEQHEKGQEINLLPSPSSSTPDSLSEAGM